MEIGVLPEQEKKEIDDDSFLEGIWNNIETGVKAVDFTDHVDYTDPLGWETLGQRWGEKTIGKKWREGQMQDVWNAVPEAWRPNITKAAMATAESVGTAWQGARTVDNWFNPLDVAAAGTARTIELAALPFEGLAQLTSAGTGLDIELSRVVADFIPVGGIAKRGAQLARRANLAKHLAKADVLVRTGDIKGAQKYLEKNVPGARVMLSTGTDLVQTFMDAQKRGDIAEMTETFNKMSEIQKKQIDHLSLHLDQQLSERKGFQQTYISESDFEAYKVKGFLRDWRVAGKGSSFDWYKFNSGTPDQKRIIAPIVATNTSHNIPVDWKTYAKTLVDNFEELYGDSPYVKSIREKYTSIRKFQGKSSFERNPYIIDVDHGVTLVQSMPIYHGLVKGSPMWDKIQQKFLEKAYRPGNAADNLTSLDRSVHSLKTAFFNTLHGADGKGFFTDEIIRKFKPGPNWTQAQADAFRLETLDRYLLEIDKGQEILKKAQKIYHYLHTNDIVIPEQVAHALAEVVTTSDGIGKYTSRELRAILKQIDALPESKAGLLHSVNDQISIQVQKVLAKEKELEPWTAITSAAEKHKLDQLTALEKELERLRQFREKTFY